jgi:hypothetical protein
MTHPGLGYVRDDADGRDRRIDALALGPGPAAVDTLADYLLRILDQGQAPACVGFATAQALRIRWCAQVEELRTAAPLTDHDVPCPSALWLWWHARHAAGDADAVTGARLRDALKSVVRFGVPDDRWWPSVNALDSATRRPGQIVFRHAWDLRTRAGRGAPVAYYRIPDTRRDSAAGVRAAVAARLPVLIGVPVPAGFGGVRVHQTAIPPPDEDRIVGGHAMVVIGYRPDAVLVVNSWGRGWGNGGTAWLDWGWVTDWARDLWVVQAPTPYGRTG